MTESADRDVMARDDNFDYQAAQHQDALIFQQATIERLVEVDVLVRTFMPSITWLRPDDIEGIAIACGLHDEFKQAIQQRKYESAKV